MGNLAGPLLLGRLFDTVGRRKMISGTYLLSGVLLTVTAILFQAGALTALTQTIAWSLIFFFASAGASAAYLTVSEIFPIEVRAKAIAVFFAIAQGFGALGPIIYGSLIGDGKDTSRLFFGYLLGAVVMMIGGVVAAALGVAAEGKSLDDPGLPSRAVDAAADRAARAPTPLASGRDRRPDRRAGRGPRLAVDGESCWPVVGRARPGPVAGARRALLLHGAGRPRR